MKPWPDPDDNTPSERALRLELLLYATLTAAAFIIPCIIGG